MRILSTKFHGALDYLVGVVLLVLPWLSGFAGLNAATYVPVTSGIVIILYSFFTNYEMGVVKILPMRMHLMLDLWAGIVLAASPWLWGFSSYVYMPHLLLGILSLFVSLMTETKPFEGKRSVDRGKYPYYHYHSGDVLRKDK